MLYFLIKKTSLFLHIQLQNKNKKIVIVWSLFFLSITSFSLVTFTSTESPEDGLVKPKPVVYIVENKILEQYYMLYFLIQKTSLFLHIQLQNKTVCYCHYHVKSRKYRPSVILWAKGHNPSEINMYGVHRCEPGSSMRARVRSPVGTSFLGEVFSEFFLTCNTNVGKL